MPKENPKFEIIRWPDALKLRNARVQEQNQARRAEGLPPIGKITNPMLGKLLFPDANPDTIYSTMSQYELGKRKYYTKEMMVTVCEVCGVDGNFLLGLPSVHDEDFRRLINPNVPKNEVDQRTTT